MEQYLRDWADQCKGHKFLLVEKQLRQAADELQQVAKRIADLEARLKQS